MNIDPATVVNIERARLRALVERDMVVAERLHAPDYQLVTPNGSTRKKNRLISATWNRSDSSTSYSSPSQKSPSDRLES
ncbi:DUF4440 domain-containing protein [Cryobacterium sp. TMT1-66-1]|uniref:DUF4440 domain-containing protein n=1 Tax=Cryobacterium sp. TMT1-66-1 TaxID=1259242 RepID=UPI00351A045D